MSNDLDYFKLMRSFWDWAFENPDLIKPTHCALYAFIVEHCNRLGWKKKFGLPTTMAMEALGIKSYNTYINCLNNLVEFGLIEMIEKSKNQYSANIVALSNFNKALDKALDKAFIKHMTKQSESTVQSTSESTDSIDKQDTIYNKPINQLTIEQEKIDFDIFWDVFDKKVGDKSKCKKKWDKYDYEKQSVILHHVEDYVKSTPDKKFRCNPETYINQERWNNEIINNQENGKQIDRIAAVFKEHHPDWDKL